MTYDELMRYKPAQGYNFDSTMPEQSQVAQVPGLGIVTFMPDGRVVLNDPSSPSGETWLTQGANGEIVQAQQEKNNDFNWGPAMAALFASTVIGPAAFGSMGTGAASSGIADAAIAAHELPAVSMLPAAQVGAGASVASAAANAANSGGSSLQDFINSQGGTYDSIYQVPSGVDASTVAPGVESSIWDSLKAVTSGTGTASDVANLAKIGLPLAGGLLGAVGADSKPAGTTTTVQDIPDWLKPYVTGNLDAAKAAMAANPQDNSLLAPATAQMNSTIAGDYLNSNPYIDRTFQMAADPVVANIASQFSKAGRYGSGAHQGVLGTTLGNLATNIYGQNYANERAKQVTAAAGAPGFTSDAGAAPFSAFGAYGNLLKQNVSSTTSPYFSNTTGGALSGALAGYGLSKAFG